MTTHELAAALLKCENLPVVINGWGSDAGTTYEVRLIDPPRQREIEPNPGEATDALGYVRKRVIALDYCGDWQPTVAEV